MAHIIWPISDGSYKPYHRANFIWLIEYKAKLKIKKSARVERFIHFNFIKSEKFPKFICKQLFLAESILVTIFFKRKSCSHESQILTFFNDRGVCL